MSNVKYNKKINVLISSVNSLIIPIKYIWQARKKRTEISVKTKVQSAVGSLCPRVGLHVRPAPAPGKTIICYSKHQHWSWLPAPTTTSLSGSLSLSLRQNSHYHQQPDRPDLLLHMDDMDYNHHQDKKGHLTLKAHFLVSMYSVRPLVKN